MRWWRKRRPGSDAYFPIYRRQHDVAGGSVSFWRRWLGWQYGGR